MERVESNNLLEILGRAWHRIFRKLVYPGFRLSYAGVCDGFLFSMFIIPSYFGIRLGFFDLTAFRLFEIFLIILVWKKAERRNEILRMARKCPHTVYIIIYIFISLCYGIILIIIQGFHLNDIYFLITYGYDINNFLFVKNT